jgi:hypothetical protein
MKTTIELTGFPDLVLQRAVDLGIARSKTEALRISVLSMNEQYGLVQSAQDEMAVARMQEMEEDMKKPGKKYLKLEDIYARFPHLKKAMR